MGHQLLHWFIGVLSLSPTHCCTVIIQLLHMTQISVHVGAHCFKLVHIGTSVYNIVWQDTSLLMTIEHLCVKVMLIH